MQQAGQQLARAEADLLEALDAGNLVAAQFTGDVAGHEAGQHLAQVGGGHDQVAPHAALVAGRDVVHGAEVGHAQPAAVGRLFPPQVLELQVDVALL